jgi:hypothetical protein
VGLDNPFFPAASKRSPTSNSHNSTTSGKNQRLICKPRLPQSPTSPSHPIDHFCSSPTALICSAHRHQQLFPTLALVLCALSPASKHSSISYNHQPLVSAFHRNHRPWRVSRLSRPNGHQSRMEDFYCIANRGIEADSVYLNRRGSSPRYRQWVRSNFIYSARGGYSTSPAFSHTKSILLEMLSSHDIGRSKLTFWLDQECARPVLPVMMLQELFSVSCCLSSSTRAACQLEINIREQADIC